MRSLQKVLWSYMQICMKLTSDARRKLAAEIQTRISESGVKQAEIALNTAVNIGQVSRICRGQFKTASHNLMQICNFLNVKFDDLGKPDDGVVHRKRLERSVLTIWDQTPEDAERIVRLLNQIAALRGMGGR